MRIVEVRNNYLILLEYPSIFPLLLRGLNVSIEQISKNTGTTWDYR